MSKGEGLFGVAVGRGEGEGGRGEGEGATGEGEGDGAGAKVVPCCTAVAAAVVGTGATVAAEAVVTACTAYPEPTAEETCCAKAGVAEAATTVLATLAGESVAEAARRENSTLNVLLCNKARRRVVGVSITTTSVI